MSSRSNLASHEAKYITLLSLTEIGVGSIVHSLKIPLGGHCLSLNQGFLLLQSSKSLKSVPRIKQNYFDSPKSVINISLMTALLKSFSPAGKKLTPMLAITVQGILFSLGLCLGGTNIFGHILAMALLSLWAFIQPLLMAWLFVGAHFWEAINLLWNKLAPPLGLENYSALSVIFFLIGIKVALAIFLVFLSNKTGTNFSESLAEKGKIALRNKSRSKSKNIQVHPIKGTLKDLRSPLVIISILLSVIFAVYAKASQATLIWALLRPLTAAFIGFYILRIFPTDKLISLFAKNNPERADLIRKVSKSLETYTS